MSDAEEPTYGPEAVCAAVEVPRATFHSWVARRYLPLSPGPGMGRERQFTVLDVVRIAVVAEFARLGISIGIAARAAGLIETLNPDGRSVDDGGYTKSGDPRSQAIVLGPTRWPLGPAAPAENTVSLALMRYATMDEVGTVATETFKSNSFALVDLSAIIPKVLAKLDDAMPAKEGSLRGRKGPKA